MKSRTWMWITALYLFAALAMAVGMAAQDVPSQNHKSKHHQYKLIDTGTFGGPASSFNYENDALNNSGVAVGASETPIPDSPQSNGYPCGPGSYVYHAFSVGNGNVSDLGTLAGDDKCSNAQMISDRGDIVGNSEIDTIDPLLGVHEIRAVRWRNGHIRDLGTLGGNDSASFVVNNPGQIVGFALNSTPDQYSFFNLLFGSPNGTQTRAFLWQEGVMRDLGTLGGPDAQAVDINDRGQVVGFSYINYIPNPSTGVPTIDPFLWENGHIIDLGGLGGTSGAPAHINERGQVVGTSNLAGNMTAHPFFWDRGVLTDLGTLGGDNGQAIWINNAGDVIGEADLLGSQVHDAFLWRHGVMTDLGNLGQTSFSYGINSEGQVVGHSKINDGTFRAFLWENGGPMVDLNSLIPSNSSLTLVNGESINDGGAIAGSGVPVGCQPADVDICGHAFLLIPCDEKHPGECDDDSVIEVGTPQTNTPVAEYPAEMKQGSESSVSPVNQFRDRLMRRYHVPGQPAAPRDYPTPTQRKKLGWGTLRIVAGT